MKVSVLERESEKRRRRKEMKLRVIFGEKGKFMSGIYKIVKKIE